MGAERATSQPSLPQFDTLWNYNDPAGTEDKFREILPQAETSQSTAYLAELLTQIARCQGLQENFDGAHATLDRAQRLLQPEMRRAQVRYLLERGRVFNSAGRADKALPLFEQAWELGRSANETRLAFDALHMIALAQPDPARRVEWNLKGIAAVQQTPSERGWLYAFYNNLGEAYAAQQDYENALKAFRDMAALDTTRGQPPEPLTQKDIAKMLRKLGRVNEALALLQPLHEDLQRKGQPNGWIDEELAECLLATGKEAEAKPLFRRAYEAQKNDAWVLKHELAKLDRLKRLAGK